MLDFSSINSFGNLNLVKEYYFVVDYFLPYFPDYSAHRPVSAASVV